MPGEFARTTPRESAPARGEIAAEYARHREARLLNVLGAACFLGWLASLALVRHAQGAGRARRRAAIRTLLLYALCASFGAGLTQRDLWPFARWPMAAGLADPRGENARLLAVDTRGIERPVDYRAWQPLGFDELNPWMHRTFPRLDPPARDRLLQHLLGVAERARLRARAGAGVGYFERYLGPFTAPYFDLHPKTWAPGAGAPPEPFVGLRVYLESWGHEERLRHPDSIHRVLLGEYPRR